MEISEREWAQLLARMDRIEEDLTALRLQIAGILSWVSIGPWLLVLVGGLAALGTFLARTP